MGHDDSLRETLGRLQQTEPKPQLGVGLVDRNRVRLTNWQLLGDCLVERWPSGGLRYLIPLHQIVLIDLADV
ncbi:MAG TPA: hypothetical protein VF322_10925 [Gammaproteobacteria bacterium]